MIKTNEIKLELSKFTKDWNDDIMDAVRSNKGTYEALVELNNWNNSNTEYVYFLVNHKTGLTKIGMTKHLTNRIKQIETDFKNICGITPSFELIGIVVCRYGNARCVEKLAHDLFKDDRAYGEWYAINPSIHPIDSLNDVSGLYDTEIDVEGVPIISECGLCDMKINICNHLTLKDLLRLEPCKENVDFSDMVEHVLDNSWTCVSENNRDLTDSINQLLSSNIPKRKHFVEKMNADDILKATSLYSRDVLLAKA